MVKKAEKGDNMTRFWYALKNLNLIITFGDKK
jgi:hypothetical protein